jgi:hypothetical protein
MKNRALAFWALFSTFACVPAAVHAEHCDGVFRASSCELKCEEASACRDQVLDGWDRERCMQAGGDVQGQIAAQCESCNKICDPSGLGWLEGVWEGMGDQNNDTSWNIRLSVHSGIYSINYPSLSCGGYWTLSDSSAGAASFVEHITSDPEKHCIDGGTISIGKLDANRIQYHWGLGSDQAGATLTKN